MKDDYLAESTDLDDEVMTEEDREAIMRIMFPDMDEEEIENNLY